MSTLVDSNILIDIARSDSPFSKWSAAQLAAVRSAGETVINQVILSETATVFRQAEAAHATIFTRLTRESLPWAAAFVAGQAHRDYRERGGTRERTLPDFLIGAHAAVKGYRLLTRDPRRYRRYFPDLDIIAPDTHP